MRALDNVKMPNGDNLTMLEYYTRNLVFAEQRAVEWFNFARKSSKTGNRVTFVGDARRFKAAREDIKYYRRELKIMREELRACQIIQPENDWK